MHSQRKEKGRFLVSYQLYTHTIWRKNWGNGQWIKYLLLKSEKHSWDAPHLCEIQAWSMCDHITEGRVTGTHCLKIWWKVTKQDAQGWYPQTHQWVRATYKHKCTHAHIPCMHRGRHTHINTHTHNSKKSKLFQMVLFKLYKEQRTGTGEMA